MPVKTCIILPINHDVDRHGKYPEGCSRFSRPPLSPAYPALHVSPIAGHIFPSSFYYGSELGAARPAQCVQRQADLPARLLKADEISQQPPESGLAIRETPVWFTGCPALRRASQTRPIWHGSSRDPLFYREKYSCRASNGRLFCARPQIRNRLAGDARPTAPEQPLQKCIATCPAAGRTCCQIKGPVWRCLPDRAHKSAIPCASKSPLGGGGCCAPVK